MKDFIENLKLFLGFCLRIFVINWQTLLVYLLRDFPPDYYLLSQNLAILKLMPKELIGSSKQGR